MHMYCKYYKCVAINKKKKRKELVIITSYPSTANGITVLVNSQTGFCRRLLFPKFYKAKNFKHGATWRTIFYMT